MVSETNNFKVLYPKLLKEWAYDKNKILPEKCSGKGNIKVWWKCKKCKEIIIYR